MGYQQAKEEREREREREREKRLHNKAAIPRTCRLELWAAADVAHTSAIERERERGERGSPALC